MPRITAALTQTSVDVLSTVSSTASAVATVTNSAANYARAMEVHSEQYLSDSIIAAEKAKHMAQDRALKRVAYAKLELKRELESDPELMDIYLALGGTTFSTQP